MHKYFRIIIVLLLIGSACTTQKELIYLSNLDTVSTPNFFPYTYPDYRIQKRDILYIRFITLNNELSDILNVGSGRYATQLYQNETSLYINGYTVNDSGNVTIPILGQVNVLGMTIDEATRNIQGKADIYLKDATVILKLISFKVTVIGEVNRPGTYTNFNNQLTVLEAIGMASDITDYGNRQQVLVVRPNPEGTSTYRINLQDKNLLLSEGFFLLPNDIVIVAPIKSKSFRLNIPTLTLFLSGLSTLILILSFIQK
jgi:polysaccharide export outer membrane protein